MNYLPGIIDLIIGIALLRFAYKVYKLEKELARQIEELKDNR